MEGTEMRNEASVYVKVSRIELCDLLLSCLAASDMANDGGEKWNRLHDKLKDQLEAFDRMVDDEDV
jgi:hypothetical protein